jgi:hypothetical protein
MRRYASNQAEKGRGVPIAVLRSVPMCAGLHGAWIRYSEQYLNSGQDPTVGRIIHWSWEAGELTALGRARGFLLLRWKELRPGS